MPKVAAHLIVGPNDEPFLGALLGSLVGAADMLVVNDNGPNPSPHDATLRKSWFGHNDRLIVDRTPFTDFSTARNVCLARHVQADAGDWVAFVDADEVHGETVRRIARRLALVPDSIDFVDGYTWHFFQSFDLYTSIERRMSFFRFSSNVRWTGTVHEHLSGLNGGRIALPYVYGHYGHVLPARRHAEKGRLYSSLGQSGEIVAREALDSLDLAAYFAAIWPTLLRYAGEHPPEARPVIERLRKLYAVDQARARAIAAQSQPFPQRLRNALMKANYEQRWRTRALNPLARHLTR
ncbi:MAG: hypothetical protein M3R35_02970 [Candidatus Eremiobacteraeota bacterium]|nr:hypothetical protein [Candidatus Eremiobacteraeota bacterium]